MMLEKIPHEAPPQTHTFSLSIYPTHFALSPFSTHSHSHDRTQNQPQSKTQTQTQKPGQDSQHRQACSV